MKMNKETTPKILRKLEKELKNRLTVIIDESPDEVLETNIKKVIEESFNYYIGKYWTEP